MALRRCQNACGIQLAETLKQLFDYTTEDALYTDFDISYENFFSGKAAMIPNGYWMMDQIPEEWTGKVRFSVFPGNKLRTKLNLEEKEELFSSSAEELKVFRHGKSIPT